MAQTLGSDATGGDGSPAPARRSGRERKPVARLSEAANAHPSKRGKGKKAAPGGDDDDSAEPEHDNEEKDADADDPSEEDEDEDEPEDDFSDEDDAPKRKRGQGRASKANGSAKKAPNATPNASVAAKGRKRAPKKKKDPDAAGGDDDEGDGAGPKDSKGDIVIEADNTLYNAVRNPNSSLQTVVDDWIEAYQEKTGPAMAELINFIFRTCGCNATIDEHQAEDENGIVDVLDGIQDEFKNADLLAYPLVSKSKVLKKFRSSLTSFISRLFTSAASAEILYDETFCQTFQSWLTSLSSSKIRSFRHTATVVSLITVSALCDVSVAVNKDFTQASRAKEAEEKKGRKDKARLKDLSTNVKDVHNKKTTLEEYLNELFEGVFVHRYRDFESIIRAECIKALGQWMKIHPDHWLEGNYLRYHGWVLSDDHKDVRHEAVKALISLYAKEDHIGGMQHFTDRFKGQLVRMATGEVDLSVRISCIHVLRQIDTHGLLEDAQRDEVATLVFEKERRVRQAVAGFFQGTLDELVEERQIELDAGSGIKGSVVKDQLKLKCVAELLVKHGRALDGIEDGDGEDEDDEGEGEGVVEDVKSHRGRVAFAVEALWGQVEVLRDWQGIMDFLLLDHSDAQGDETPKKGKGKKGKGKAKANGAGGDSEVEPACRLTEDEESLLVEVLVASLGKATGHSATSKKEKEEEESLSEISRAVIEALPRLFAKHQTVPARVVDILAIPTLISLDLYLDMRMLSSYETLWDDISKQFLKHADPRVIDQAVQTIIHLFETKTLGKVNSTKMTELEETLISSLRTAVSGKDVEAAAFEEDELFVIASAVLRVSRLYAATDLSKALDDAEDGKSSAWEIVDSLVQRGRLGYKDEVSIVENAISILGSHFVWSLGKLVRSPEGNFEHAEVLELAERRNALTEKLEDLAVGLNANAGEGVKQAALVLLLHIYLVCVTTTSTVSDPDGRFEELKMECSDELQARCAGFVEAEIERYREALVEDADEPEEGDEADREDETEDSDDDVAEKRRKKKVNAKRAEEKRAKAQGKKKALKVKTPAEIRAENAKSQARLVAAGLFDRTIGAFVRAVHHDIISLHHASVILIHLERFDATFDLWAKLLVQDMRDEGIYGDAGSTVARIAVDSLKGACELFLDSPDPSDSHLIALSRLLSTAVVVRGAQLAIVNRLQVSDHVQLHTDSLAYILREFAVLKEGKKKDASQKALAFFKALGNLLIGIEGQGALKIKTSLESLLEANDIQVLTSAKAWEPVRGYQRRLITAMAKDPSIKSAAKEKVKRAAAQLEDEGLDDDEIEASPAPSPAAKGKGKAKAKAKPRPRARGGKAAKAPSVESGGDDDEDDAPEVLPPRRKRGAPATDDAPEASGSANGTAKKRRVDESPEPVAANGEGGEDSDEIAEEEEEVESLLLPSSQVKPPKRPLSLEPEEDEAEDEIADEDAEESLHSFAAKVMPPPSDAGSVASLSDIRRYKKKPRR